jgi:hypothetical protein
MTKVKRMNDKNLEAVKQLLPCYDQWWMQYDIEKDMLKLRIKLLVSAEVYDLHLNENSVIYKFMIGKRRYFSMKHIMSIRDIGKCNDVITNLLYTIQIEIRKYKMGLLNNSIYEKECVLQQLKLAL